MNWKICVLSFVVGSFMFGFLPIVFAEEVKYPQVSSLTPVIVKPGEIITLQGKNFGREGQTYCWSPEKKLMTYQTVIGAYKKGTAPTSGLPQYRLPIISASESTLVAQIPANMTNGEYVVGYNAEYPKGVCQGYGDILVGFARYDPLTVVGGSEPAIPSKSATPTSGPVVMEKPSMTPEPSIMPPADSEKTDVSVAGFSFQALFTSFVQRLRTFFGFYR